LTRGVRYWTSRTAREEVAGMRWWQFALLGGIGGALAEFVALF
jgi:hypothetical protein